MAYADPTPDGTYTFTLGVGGIEDLDGQPLTGPSSRSFVLDTFAPRIISSTPGIAGPTAPATVTFRLVWNEPVTGFFALSDVAVQTTGTGAGVVESIAEAGGGGSEYDVAVALSGTGTVAVGAAVSAATDAAGLPSVAGAFSTPISVVSTRPSLEVFEADIPNPSAAATSTVVTLKWSEPVTGFDQSDISIATTDLTYSSAVLAAAPGGTAGVDYTLAIGGIASGNDGALDIRVPAGRVMPAVGLPNEEQRLLQRIDGEGPSASIVSSEPSPTFSGTLRWDIAFDEPVVLPTYTFSATPSEEVIIGTTGDAGYGFTTQQHGNVSFPNFRDYSIFLSLVTGSGTLTPRIEAGTVFDAVGNPNPAQIDGTAISRLDPNIAVGNTTVSTQGVAVTVLGGGDYDVAAGAVIQGVRANTPIEIRGNIATGDGELRLDGSGNVLLHTGPFTLQGLDERIEFDTPEADNLAWAGVPIGVCSIWLDGGVYIDGWFDVADFAGNSFTNMRLNQFPGQFAPQLFSFRLGDASCEPATSITLLGTFAESPSGGLAISGLSSSIVPSGSSTPLFRLTASGIGATGDFLYGGHYIPYTDISTSADGIAYQSDYDFGGGLRGSLDDVRYSFASGYVVSNFGSVTSDSGDVSASFTTNFLGDALLVLDSFTFHTTTAFGDIPISGGYLVSTPGNASLFFLPDETTVELAAIPFDTDVDMADDGLSTGELSLLDLNGITLSFAGLAASADGVALSGGAFEVLGLAFNISVTEPDTGGFSIEGGFALPSNLAALSSISMAATVTVTDEPGGTKINLDGLEFCTPESGALKIKKSNFALPQVCFSYSEVPVREIGGDVTFGIPEVIDLSAGASVRGGKVDRISVGLDGLSIPIDATGAVLESISATVKNLSRTPAEWEEIYYEFQPGMPPVERTRTLSGTAPIKVEGTMGASAGPSIGPLSLISAEVGSKIDENQFRMEGTVTLLVVNVGGGYLHVRWSGQNQGVALGGYMTYLLVIRGSVVAALDFLGNFAGCAAVTIRIPDGLPFAGTEFGGVSVCVTAPPFLIRGCLTVLEAQLCLSINADGDVSFGTRAGAYRDWETPVHAAMPLHSTDARTGEPRTMYASMFTNYRQAGKSYSDTLPAAERGAGMLPLNVAAGPGRIVRLTYELAGGNPAFNLHTPSGEIYTPAMVLGAVDPDTAPAVYFASADRREAGYILRDAEGGEYQLELADPSSLGLHAAEALVPNEEPTVAITDVAVAGSTLNFAWTDSDSDDDAAISIGLDTDRFNADGARILSGISENDPANMASHDLAATPIQPGWYWPYAMIEDPGHAPVVAYAPMPIFVPDADGSAPIENFQVSGADGTASVSFTPVADPDVVSYKLSWTDDALDWTMANSAAIPMEESGQLVHGLKNDQPYKFAIAAVSLVESSALLRAGKFAALDAAVSAIGTADRATALEQARAALAAHRAEGSAAEALAHLAVETAAGNALWASASRSAEFADFVERSASAASAAPRGGAITRRYVDSHFAVSDTVILRRSEGANNPPMFAGEPAPAVRRGETYAAQLDAEDPEGQAVTFALASGPAGMTVSGAGAVAWATGSNPTGDYAVRVSATDAAGARAMMEWTIAVVDLIAEPPFAIASRPDGNAGLGSVWSYQPTLAGASGDAAPAWALDSAPAGMAIDPATGAITWNTAGTTLAADGLASFRVILSVREGGARNRLAIQEFSVDVEDRLDAVRSLDFPEAGDTLIVR